MSPPEGMQEPATPPDSPLTMHDVMKSSEYRDLSTPRVGVGDPAVDFTLPQRDFSQGTERETGRTVTLSAYSGERPVALIFGSYT